MSHLSLTAGVVMVSGFLLGQHINIDKFKQPYTDSLYINPSFSSSISDSVLVILGRASSSDFRNGKQEITEQKAFWNKQKGTSQYVQKKYTSAIQHYQSSYNYYRLLKDTLGMSKALSNMGICYEEQNIDDQALSKYNNALELLRSTEDAFKYTVLNNILSLLLKKELYETVKSEGLIALKSPEIEAYTQMSILANVGAAYSGLNKYDSATFFTNQAYKIASENDFHVNEIQLLINLANQDQKNNSLNEAKRHLLSAKQLSTKYQYDNFNKNIFQGLGIIYFKLSKFSLANDYYEKALQLARADNDKYLVADLLQNISVCKKELGDFKSAYKNLKEYTTLKDSLQGIESKKAVAELSTKYRSLEQQNKILRLNNEKNLLQLDAKLKAATIENQEINLSNRKWLIIGLIIILGVSIFSFYLFYSRKKIAAAKTELDIRNQKLEIERKLLQSQMNPHFIFNALNSIQRFVSESDAFNAQIYLGRFGKLMRNILEQSRKSQISLEEEIETLELYIELEKLRYNNSFSAVITSDFDDDSDVKIPPMIIQPFVENAILHGFKGIDYPGILRIQFKQADETTILCTIEDNGKGRKKTKEKTDSSTLNKTSLGTQVTQNRLDAISPDGKESIVYEDLPTGTRVNVYFYS